MQAATIGDDTYWMHSESSATKMPSPDVQLLAGFDEYLLGYTDRRFQLQAIHNTRVIHSNGIFHPAVMVDGQIVGTWGRKATKGKWVVASTLFAPLNRRAMRNLDDAVARYGAFMGVTTQLEVIDAAR